jgi:cytochrome c oxidase assembly factor CtaG
VALVVAVLVPPIEVLARRYLYLESIQFCVLAMIAPALIVLGAPRDDGWPQPGRAAATPFVKAAVFLCAWVGVCLVWRLPPVLDGLARDPVLAVAELVTMLPAGIFLWLELAGPRSSGPLLARPWRAVVAAGAMWAIWIIAYILGFSRGPVVHAYHSGLLGTANDQELAAVVLWLVSTFSFAPLVFVPVLTWLRDGADPREEGRRPASLGVRGWSKWARLRRGTPPEAAGKVAPPRLPRQLGRLGGDTLAESDLLAVVISASNRARSALSACWSRRSWADARCAAAGVLAVTIAATSSCTRCASGNAQVTRSFTAVSR